MEKQFETKLVTGVVTLFVVVTGSVNALVSLLFGLNAIFGVQNWLNFVVYHLIWLIVLAVTFLVLWLTAIRNKWTVQGDFLQNRTIRLIGGTLIIVAALLSLGKSLPAAVLSLVAYSGRIAEINEIGGSGISLAYILNIVINLLSSMLYIVQAAVGIHLIRRVKKSDAQPSAANH